WGWRIPFLISAGLLVVSVYIRSKTAESPAFKVIKEKGHVSKAPFREAFTQWRNLRWVLIALFGFMMAQGVVWYTSYFYTQVFMEKIVRLDQTTINILLVGMLA